MKQLRLTSYALTDAANLERRREKRSAPPDDDPIWRQVVFHICEQSHLGQAFGSHRSNRFEASNGIVLRSSSGPHWDGKRIFDVRGSGLVPPDTPLVASMKDFHEIEHAVHEYNNHDWEREERAGYDDLEGE